nr:transposase [Streptacidiphilus jeojiense]
MRIERHWEDILRIIGSIHTGAVRAHNVIRMLSGEGRPTPLGDAIAHYGRITKTLHILRSDSCSTPSYSSTPGTWMPR